VLERPIDEARDETPIGEVDLRLALPLRVLDSHDVPPCVAVPPPLVRLRFFFRPL
jgi:hypothetical protein